MLTELAVAISTNQEKILEFALWDRAMLEATSSSFFHNKAKCTSGPMMSRPMERTFPRPGGTVDWLWRTRAFTWCYNWVWDEKEDTYWGGFKEAQLFERHRATVPSLRSRRPRVGTNNPGRLRRRNSLQCNSAGALSISLFTFHF